VKQPHVRGELPWLRSGPLFRIHRDGEPELDAFLARHAYERIDLDGSAVHDRRSAHALLSAAFGFPDWHGGNWDAFNDCIHGWVADHDGGRVAVVWHDLETSARQAPVTTTEVGWALIDTAFGHRWSTEGRPTVWMDVFAVGAGDDFDRPSED
jgi:RNAse (barnase) inhibitor barstar